MILTNKQLELLNKCIGAGPINTAPIVIFGNELGTAAGGNTEKTIARFEEDWIDKPKLDLGEGFSTLNIGIPPVNSAFLQFISRMALAVKHKDERFFDKLSGPGQAFLNNYIMNHLYREDTAIINLRPLPQGTESEWDYENVDEKEYYRMYNFSLRRSSSDTWRDMRVKAIKCGFESARNALVLGTGDKNVKKAFFEKEMNVTFEKVKLTEKLEIYVSKNPKIILSNYYDHRSGVKLTGLKEIYRYIIKNNMI